MAGAFPSRAQIAEAQLKNLRALLASISVNKFYQAKLGGKAAVISSLEQFVREIPFTTKQELLTDQQAHPPFGSNLTFELSEYTRFHATSGTSGQPLRWLDTAASWQWMLNNWKEIFSRACVARGDRVFFAFTFGPFIGFWLAFEAAEQLGCLCLPGGGMRSRARLQMIAQTNVQVLCCTPTYAIHLGEIAAQENPAARETVRLIIVAGEPGGSVPATRARLRELWPNARIFDHHGMTEVGPVTYECPQNPGTLHVLDESYLAEVIDPAAAEVGASRCDVHPLGKTGELVLTPLGRNASPLLRYRTGDIVRTASEVRCQCGSEETALVGGIIGRVDDMVVVRGVNIFPAAVEDVMFRFAEVVEYRAVVRGGTVGLGELEIEVEPKEASAANLASRLEQALHAAFNLRIKVTEVPIGSLPRAEMKARRWCKAG